MSVILDGSYYKKHKNDYHGSMVQNRNLYTNIKHH